jgi:hypothetical protein
MAMQSWRGTLCRRFLWRFLGNTLELPSVYSVTRFEPKKNKFLQYNKSPIIFIMLFPETFGSIPRATNWIPLGYTNTGLYSYLPTRCWLLIRGIATYTVRLYPVVSYRRFIAQPFVLGCLTLKIAYYKEFLKQADGGIDPCLLPFPALVLANMNSTGQLHFSRDLFFEYMSCPFGLYNCCHQ